MALTGQVLTSVLQQRWLGIEKSGDGLSDEKLANWWTSHETVSVCLKCFFVVKYTDIAVRSLTNLTATGIHMPYRITQRWHSCLYPSWSWYSIKRPRRDARLSWPSWLVTKSVTHPGTNRARGGLTPFMWRTLLTTTPRRHYVIIMFDVCLCCPLCGHFMPVTHKS